MRHTWAVVAVSLLGTVQKASGYMCYQSGIGTVLVAQGRVYFSQADESLTCLDLATGRVIIRARPDTAFGTLSDSDAGILQLGWQKSALLNRDTLEPVWEAKAYLQAQLHQGRLFGYDARGIAVCRDPRDGRIVWRYELPNNNDGWEDMALSANRALLFPRGRGQTPAVVLDLVSGREVAVLRPARGQYFLCGVLEDERVFIAAGDFEQGSNHFHNLLIFTTDGKLVSSTPTPPDVAKELYYGAPVTVGDVVFSSRGVRSGASSPPLEPVETRDERSYRWESCTLRISRIVAKPALTVLSAQPRAGRPWRGVLPYLDPSGVARATLDGDRLLLATDFGHLECIDVLSGRSVWLYSSSTRVVVASWTSPNGMPPRLTERERVFRRQNANREHLAGLCLIPDGTPDQSIGDLVKDPLKLVYPPITHDPVPYDLWGDLPQLVRAAWSGPAITLALTGLLMLFCRRRFFPAAAAILLPLFAVGLSQWLQQTCRISDGATLCMKITIVALAAAFPFFAFRAFKPRRHWQLCASGIAATASLAWCWHIVVLLRFG